jgi:hypothetical protein
LKSWSQFFETIQGFFKGNLLKETKSNLEKDSKSEVIGGKSKATKKSEKIVEF